MRGELGPAGVRVHNVEPSWTATSLSDAYAEGVTAVAARAPELVATALAPDPAVVPLGAKDVAAVVAFAVSAPPGVNISHVAGPTLLG